MTALTSKDLAHRWNVHLNTVKRLGDRGELPFFRVTSRGDRRYWLADVEAYEQRLLPSSHFNRKRTA